MIIGFLLALFGVVSEFSRGFFPENERLLFEIATVSISTGAIVSFYFGRNMIRNTEFKNGSRYLIGIPLGGVFCSTADFILPDNFILGMVIFLIGHIFFIYAFSGLFEFNFKGKNRIIVLLAFAYGIVIYFGWLFNPDDFMTIVIIPYILVISFMMSYTLIGWSSSYDNKFKLSLILGSILFVASDSVLALRKFSDGFPSTGDFVGHSYILAIFFILHSFYIGYGRSD